MKNKKVREELTNLIKTLSWIEKAVFYFYDCDEEWLTFCVQTPKEEFNWKFHKKIKFQAEDEEMKAQLVENNVSIKDIHELQEKLKSFYKKYPKFSKSAIFCYEDKKLRLCPEPDSW